MKNLKKFMPFVLLVATPGSAEPAPQVTGLNPKSNVTKAFEFWMGKRADCTDMVKVIDLGASGKDVDTELGVDFGSGSLPVAGTYNCLAIVVNDANTLQPATTSGGCDASKHYIHRTFRTGDKSVMPGDVTAWLAGDTSKQINPDGKWTSGNYVAQKVAAYFSTQGSDGNSGHYPIDALPLTGGAVTVGTDSMSKTFFVSCAGKVGDGQADTLTVEDDVVGNGCATDACSVGFR